MYLDKAFIKHLNICVVPKKELVCVFPFLGKSHWKSKRDYKMLSKELYILKVTFKSPSKIVNHFHFKDVIPKKLCSGIVYSFKCNSCNAIYYGKTKRHFYVRAAEHMRVSHLTNKRLKNVKQSAISDHVLTFDCNISINGFTILSKDSNNINLLIKESVSISCDKPILNKTMKSFP